MEEVKEFQMKGEYHLYGDILAIIFFFQQELGKTNERIQLENQETSGLNEKETGQMNFFFSQLQLI